MAASSRTVTVYQLKKQIGKAGGDRPCDHESTYGIIAALDRAWRNRSTGPPILHGNMGIGVAGMVMALHVLMEQVVNIRAEYDLKTRLLKQAQEKAREQRAKARRGDKSDASSQGAVDMRPGQRDDDKDRLDRYTRSAAMWARSLQRMRLSIAPGKPIWLNYTTACRTRQRARPFSDRSEPDEEDGVPVNEVDSKDTFLDWFDNEDCRSGDSAACDVILGEDNLSHPAGRQAALVWMIL